jgi:hypothetical protein
MARWPRAEVKRVTGRTNALLDGSTIDISPITDFEDCYF